MSEQTIDVRIQAVLDGFAANLAKANAEVRTTVAEMKGAFASLKEGVEALSVGFAAITGVLAGGAAFKEVIGVTREWTGEVVALARRLGLSTEEASGLAVALHHVGLSADEYATFAQKMTRQMRQNTQAFDDLGIKTKDANGEWRNSQDVMQDVITKLSGMEAGTNRNIAASALFGARVGALGPLLRLNSEALDEAREKAVQFGLVVGPEGAAQAKQYKDAMAEVHLAWLAFQNFLGQTALPTLTEMARWFADEGPQALMQFKEAMAAIDMAGELLSYTLNSINTGAQWLANTLRALARGDLDAVKSAWSAMQAEGQRAYDATKARLDGIQKDLRDAEARVANPKAFVTSGTRSGGETLGGETPGGKDPKDKANKEYEAFAAMIKAKEEAEREHLDIVVDLREQLYAKAVSLFGQESKQAQSALREVEAAQRAAAQDRAAAEKLAADVARDGQLAELQQLRDALAQKKALGQVNATESLQAERNLADAEYAIRREALEEEAALNADRPAKLREVNAELERLDQQHATAVAKSQGEIATSITQTWSGVSTAVGNAAGGMFTGLLTGSQTFMGTLGGLALEFERMWAGAIARTVAHWVAGEAAKTGATASATALRWALEVAQSARSLALQAANALKWIVTEGAKAAASAWTSVSQVPIVGWLMGPAVAAATLAGVLALGGRIASASGGFDIPSGLNPVTQLHAEEMVLPAHIANPLRDMLAGGGETAGGGNVTHIHAMDARSFIDFAKRNPEGFAHGVKGAVRAGHLPNVAG